MNFQLAPELDKNKIFLVKRSELEGRFDPHFHKSEFREIENKINLCPWYASKLKDLFEITRGGSPRPIQKYLTKNEDGVNWIKIGDTKGIDKYIYETKQKIKPAGTKYSRQVFEGDFILSNSMSFGKPFIMKTTGYIHDGWLLFRGVTDRASKNYLHTVLGADFVYLLFKKQTIGGVVENLNINLVKNIKIPIPPKEIQAQVVAKMDAAYATKKQKKAQATQLLQGIDDYLLGELGIELPEQAENTLQNRIFTRQLSEVSGGRFDAPIHQKQYILETEKYPMSKLRDCVFINPLTSFFGLSPDMSATFIPMEKVSGQYGDADISDCRMLEESGGYTKFQDNDLLWAKITPCMQNGKSAVVSGLHNSIGFGSTEFHVFRARQGIDIRYIFGLLRLRSLRNHAVLYFSGSAGHQRVSDEFFKRLSIPKPSLEKQTKIANHITKIRSQAKQLQQQAKAGLAQTKKGVEAMILGEDASV